ncbi:MAG: HesA/MoeB/ThiF family protein [Anaerolineae bacterium]
MPEPAMRDPGLETALQQMRAQGSVTLLLDDARRLSERTGRSRAQVEYAALRAGLAPARYQRNLGTIGVEGQIRLLEATVAVVGAGGLGGWIVEGLARMGIGRLIVIDSDAFEESNLNRQLGCTERTLGRPKAMCLAERIAEVNGSVQVVPHVARFTAETAAELLREAEVVVDALDSFPARLALQAAAAELAMPLVHGAIAGYTGQVMTILPGDAGLEALYAHRTLPERGVETEFGNPSATPMMVAAWQIHEVVKLLVGQGEVLRHRVLLMDAEFGTFTEIQVE